MLTGIAPTADDGTVNMEISYEDDAGNVSTTEKSITLFVTEDMSFDDMMGGDPMMGEDGMMMPEEGGGNSKGLIIGIIVAVVVVAAAGLGVFLTIRRKKKAAKLLAEELEDLEDSDEIS